MSYEGSVPQLDAQGTRIGTMTRQTDLTLGGVAVAVSNPGGLARQFRVQCRKTSGADWRMYGTFHDREQAERCVARLRRNGFQVRLVNYAICPTAG